MNIKTILEKKNYNDMRYAVQDLERKLISIKNRKSSFGIGCLIRKGEQSYNLINYILGVTN